MAQRGVNKVILMGNLGQDPEVRYMPNGNPVASLSVATSEVWKDKETGQPQERTEWHRVSLFGKTAEIAGQYLRKGSKVYIEGMLRTRKYQAQDGTERYSTEVVVDINGQMQMVDARADNQSGQQSPPADRRGGGQARQGQHIPASRPAAQPTQGGGFDDLDDIPF